MLEGCSLERIPRMAVKITNRTALERKGSRQSGFGSWLVVPLTVPYELLFCGAEFNGSPISIDNENIISIICDHEIQICLRAIRKQEARGTGAIGIHDVSAAKSGAPHLAGYALGSNSVK